MRFLFRSSCLRRSQDPLSFRPKRSVVTCGLRGGAVINSAHPSRQFPESNCPPLVIPTGAPQERSGGICSLRGGVAINSVDPSRQLSGK
jgi:hypothetical protein